MIEESALAHATAQVSVEPNAVELQSELDAQTEVAFAKNNVAHV